jgi:hypothetical protein
MARKSIRINGIECIDGQVHLYIVRGQQLKDTTSDQLNFRIYRKQEDNYLQGFDYQEYFDNIDWKEAELIYEGPVERKERFHFVFTDSNVEFLKVYSYWAAYEEDDVPAGPAVVSVRDPRVWWSFSRIQETLKRIYDAYPGEKSMKVYGRSTRKKPLTGLRIGNPEKVVGLIGTVHAGESGPELFLSAMENIVKECPELLDEVGIAVLPSVNADGREDMVQGYPHYVRCNPNQVDLNRNFDASWEEIDYTYGLNTSILGSATYRGPYPGSEDETQAVMSFIDDIRPKVIFDGHCLASICSDCFLTAKSAKDDSAFNDLGKKFCTAYTKGFRDVEKEGIRYVFGCTAGSVPAYAYEKYRIPAFDMEFRPVKDEARERSCINGNTTFDLLDEFIEYHTKGIVHVLELLKEM